MPPRPVSIPEGAIEGDVDGQHANAANLFQYPKVRLKDGGRSQYMDTEKFQYPKVRLKATSIRAATMATRGFNTRRCDWRSRRRGRCSPFCPCFNTRRCDWRGRSFGTMSPTTTVSIPEGAIEGWARSGCIDSEFRFQYPKVRLKARIQVTAPVQHRVSIPEGAIEGGANRGVPNGGILFQYPKVRLKVKA